MAFHKDPMVTDRQEVIADERRRRSIRRKLSGDVEVARELLSPAYQYRRWMKRNKAEAKRVGKNAAQTAQKNAPVIGAVGVGILVFLGRKPISKWILRLRNGKNKT